MSRIGTHEVVIIGGGAVGCAAAFFLACRGTDVAIVEREEQVGTEASGRSAGGIRQNGRHPAELPLAMASVRLWEQFRDELGGQFEYDQHGQLYLGRNEEELAALKEAVWRLQTLGLEVHYVAGPDLRELCPGLGDAVLGASYCPSDGFANPILATRFLAQCALQAGATIYLNTRVTCLKEQSGGIHAVETSRGEIATGAVISAAGPWANEMAALVGVRLPIFPRRTQAVATLPLRRRVLHQFISGNRVWVRPTRANNLLIGGGGPWNPVGFNYETSLASLNRFALRGAELLPALRETSLLRSWSGIVSYSPDHLSIVDHMPGVENMVFATGCSGHAFCLAPGIGRVLAEMVQGEAPTIPIDGLRLNRFPPDLDMGTLQQTTPEPI